MSDTPRTDKEIVGEWLVFASFARKLERELAAVTEERDELKSKYRTHHDEAERITNEIRRVSSVCRELREQRDRLERERDEARESLKEIAIQLVKEECRASFNLDTCNLYKGLLIELHNDINVIHSGNAIAKLNRMFKEENYN
jgi:chromosome segregation ATPase